MRNYSNLLSLIILFAAFPFLGLAQKYKTTLASKPTMTSIRDFDEVTITPTQNQSGFVMEMKANKNFADQGFTVNINDKQYNFFDNGVAPDGTANDGIYTGLVNEKISAKRQEKLKIDNKGNLIAGSSFGCTVKTVPCWEGCRSALFGTKCNVCIHIECHF